MDKNANIQEQFKKSKKEKVSKTEKKNKKAKTKSVTKSQIVEADEPSDAPVIICTNIPSYKKIKKIVESSTFKSEEIKNSSKKLNENKLKIAKTSNCSLRRDKNLDESLQKEYEEKVGKTRKQKSSLPIFKKRAEILELIDKNPVIVVHGEPQTGKTTQIPQFILDEFIKSGNGSLCKIVSTQPYKKFVTSAFEKVCEERKTIYGNAVGISFQFRFDSLLSRKSGSITYCTSGTLLQKISFSLFINEITHLIIDEIQERDVPTDLLLGFVKELITERTDIKLILICNTIYSRKISKYFDKCSKINVTGELFPVDEYYLKDTLMLINYNNVLNNTHKDALTKYIINYEKSDKKNTFLIISIINYILYKYKEGAILILLPSISDLHFIHSNLEKNESINSITQIFNLPNIATSSKLKYNSNKRRIFLSTNERFVHLNNNDISFVINSGKIQVKFCDVITNVEVVKYDWISQKASKQRKNLAGRKAPGICFHLFSQETKQKLDKYSIPDILSSDLENVILTIKEFGIENAELFLQSCLTCPDINCIRKTIENFKSTKILNSEEYLTRLGSHVSQLPLKYTVGKMVILGALFSCLEPILTIAALFNFRSIFIGRDMDVCEKKQQLSKNDSDILLILELLNEFEKSSKSEEDFYTDNLLRSCVFKDIDNIIQQLADRLYSMNFIHSNEFEKEEYNVNSNNTSLIKALLSVALYPNIAVIRNFNSNKTKNISVETITNRKVLIHPSSINRGKSNLPTPLLMYRSLLQSKHDFVQETTFLSPLQVLFFADDVKYSKENQYSVITVADSLKIFCTENTSLIIQSVQENFNLWLKYKLRYPDWVNWSTTDTSILQAVIELLNNERRINECLVVGNSPE